MNRVQSVVTACALVAMAGGVARADVETWQTPLSASITGFSGDVGFSFFVPLFDTQGGTRVLTGVEVGGSVTLVGSTQARNVDVMPVSLTVQFAAGFDAGLPGGLISAFRLTSDTVTDLFPDTVRGFQFVVDASIVGVASNTQAFAAPHGGVATQSGTFTAALTLPPVSTVQWNPGTLQMGGTLELRYTYTPVPTPGAASLVLLGGVGAMMRGRRRGW